MMSNLSRGQLKTLLEKGLATIEFTKKDGTHRVIECTLKDVPQYEKKTDRTKAVNEDILPVWDIKLQEWRSITVATITSVNVGSNDPRQLSFNI